MNRNDVSTCVSFSFVSFFLDRRMLISKNGPLQTRLQISKLSPLSPHPAERPRRQLPERLEFRAVA